MKLKHIILSASVIAGVVGWSNYGPWWLGALSPISAILFIVFFIMNLMEKESAGYDQDQIQKTEQLKHIHSFTPPPRPGQQPPFKQAA